MAKDSALYQLMDIRMNGVMNDITNSDGEYQGIIEIYACKRHSVFGDGRMQGTAAKKTRLGKADARKWEFSAVTYNQQFYL